MARVDRIRLRKRLLEATRDLLHPRVAFCSETAIFILHVARSLFGDVVAKKDDEAVVFPEFLFGHEEGL